jgi:transglutaminase-like putative cysteine protease
MTVSRGGYDRLVLVTIGLSILTFIAADDKPWLLPLAIPVLLGAGWLRRPGRPSAMPPMVINALVLGAIVFAALRTTVLNVGEPIVSTLGQFLVIILLIKLFDRRSARDDAQVLTLCVFILIAAVLTSNSMLTGVLLLGVSLAGIGTSMLWHIRAGQAAALGPDGWLRLDVATGPGTPAQGREARTSFRRLWAGSALACCAIAMGVFILAPRGLGTDALGRLGAPRETQIGFREQVRLGEAGLLSDNPTPVMDVKVDRELGLGGEASMLYLRGSVSEFYNPERAAWEDKDQWDGSVPVQALTRWWLPRRTTRSTDGAATRAATARTLTITQRAATPGGNLFTLWRPLAITADKPFRAQRAVDSQALRRTDGSVPFTYTVESQLAAAPEPVPEFRLGFQDGPIRALAERILADAGLTSPERRTSRAAVTALRDALREPPFAYTLEMIAPPSGADPIEFFLFDSRRGHCEYFASALAALCQSAGIPARVVAGYVATEYNQFSGQYLVRESNAHAWVEAFITTDHEAGLGRWETFEASPPGDIERIHRPESGLLAQVRGWYEALEFGWSSSIIGFDAIRQSRLLGRSPEQARDRIAGVNSAAERFVAWMRNRGGRQRPEPDDPAGPSWLGPAVAGGAVVACGWFGLVALRRWQRGRAAVRHDPELAALLAQATFYPKALRLLAKAGKAKPETRPALTHARVLAASDPALAELFAELARLYYRVRFGRQPLTTTELARADAVLASLRQRTATPDAP